jgi:hypothetical protein
MYIFYMPVRPMICHTWATNNYSETITLNFIFFNNVLCLTRRGLSRFTRLKKPTLTQNLPVPIRPIS